MQNSSSAFFFYEWHMVNLARGAEAALQQQQGQLLQTQAETPDKLCSHREIPLSLRLSSHHQRFRKCL
jgi:hypothetical protein